MIKKDKCLAATTIIYSIMRTYEVGELNSHGEEIVSRCGRYMRASTKNNDNYIKVVMKTDEAWKATIKHFMSEKTTIEAKSTVSAIFRYFEEELKIANITNKLMENWTKEMIADATIEANSNIVADYIIEAMGMPKKANPLKTRLTILKQNRIIEGK